jgi:hypothetical protein
MPTAQQIERALDKVHDEATFIQDLLIDTLQWPIDPSVKTVEEIAYDWDKEELKAHDLDRRIVDGKVRQIALPACPWGVFIVEFKNPDIFKSGRGMTTPLRQVLAGLVPRQRKSAHLPSFFREHLLFICTHEYKYFRFVHFKDPGASFKTPPLASFGWWPGDSTKTVCNYNLPHLIYLDEKATVDDWLSEWSTAFDVERVTKKFYEDYKQIHALFRDSLKGVSEAADRTWLASVLLNRLMFVYFLQKKGFLDDGNELYLERKLAESKGKDRFHTDFLTPLFFEGFAKPPEKRSDAAKAKLGNIRYLNGGLFLEHLIERKAREAGKTISLPDSVFEQLFKLFGSFSWNLNDKPGGQDNEINPDVLGYIVEKYINQKAFGAYYTRPEITGYLCERTIHRLVLDAVNTPPQTIDSMKQAGLPVRSFKSVADLLKRLDAALATKLLDHVLPNLSLLDPACGSGAFLVAAMKALIDIYANIYGWIEFNGPPELKRRAKDDRAKHKSLDYFIKKRIITDNLYGVDIMEEAVEIARLRLFLALAASANTVEELEPLPNIDFNILRGNSLIGLMHVDATRVEAKGKTGHLGGLLFQQKSYADVLADRNRQLENYRHFSAYADDLTALRDHITAINDQAQNTLDEILLADFEGLGIKLEQATWDDEKNAEGKPMKRALQLDDIRELHPFHWAFNFDKVMGRGGFDAIITNPPWEVVKPNGKEFFEQHSELVSKKNMSIHDFQDEQKKLLKDAEIRESWLKYLNSFPHQSLYFRTAPEYSNQIGVVNGKKVGSDLNLYKLFTERCYRLLRENGQCGIVIPSGIYTDLGAKQLRSMVFEASEVRHLRSFSNERFIFEGVHHSQKFCLLLFSRGGKTDSFEASFRINPRQAVSPSELGYFLDDPAAAIHLEWELVRRLSPDALSVVEFQGTVDVSIARKVMRFPLLGADSLPHWKIRFQSEFHMTNDSHLFQAVKRSGLRPLYEGKMIHQFDHRFEYPRYWVDEASCRKAILGSVQDTGQQLDYQDFRLGFRKVARSTDERTMIATIIPPNFHAENFQSIRTYERGERIVPNEVLLYLCAILNSLVADYLTRLRVTANVNFFYIYQLPIPRPSLTDRGFGKIVRHSTMLTCVTPEYDSIAKAIGLNPPDHRGGVTDTESRAKLRLELDAMAAHLYGLNEMEFTHILGTFPLIRQSEKQATLDEFVRMRDSGEAAVFNPELAKPAIATAVDPALAVRELIKGGESATVELKTTARWNVKIGQPDKKMEQIIAKSVAAFLNSKGGTLIIGVEDNGNVYGLAEDYKISGNKGRDGFELWLMQTLLKDFGKDAAGQIEIGFHELKAPDPAQTPPPPAGSGDVCVVTAKPSPKPRFVVENGQEIFYIRTGNASNALKPSELLPYYNAHWHQGAAGDET